MKRQCKNKISNLEVHYGQYSSIQFKIEQWINLDKEGISEEWSAGITKDKRLVLIKQDCFKGEVICKIYSHWDHVVTNHDIPQEIRSVFYSNELLIDMWSRE